MLCVLDRVKGIYFVDSVHEVSAGKNNPYFTAVGGVSSQQQYKAHKCIESLYGLITDINDIGVIEWVTLCSNA